MNYSPAYGRGNLHTIHFTRSAQWPWANDPVRPTWLNLIKDLFKQLNAFERFVMALTLLVLLGFYFLKPDTGMAGIICLLAVTVMWTVLFARMRNIL